MGSLSDFPSLKHIIPNIELLTDDLPNEASLSTELPTSVCELTFHIDPKKSEKSVRAEIGRLLENGLNDLDQLPNLTELHLKGYSVRLPSLPLAFKDDILMAMHRRGGEIKLV